MHSTDRNTVRLPSSPRILSQVPASVFLDQHTFCRYRDDRLAWVSALAGQKLQISAKGATYQDQSALLSKHLLGGSGRVSPPVASAAKLLEDLKKKDAMVDPSCQRIVVALQKEIRDADAALQEKDKQIQQLMDERRQLQTELVTESQRLDHLVRCAVCPCFSTLQQIPPF